MENKPKKSLGQNFLIDKNIINLIVDLGKINENDTVLEVGPGTGNLTKAILLKKPIYNSNYITISIGGFSQPKLWNIQNWSNLIDMIIKTKNCKKNTHGNFY